MLIKKGSVVNWVSGGEVFINWCIQVFLLSLCLWALSGCGGGSSESVQTPVANTAPSANAGVDQTVKEFAAVTLSASSIDADGDEISYSWSQTEGPSVELDGANTSKLEFSAPDVNEGDPQTLVFSLTTSDPGGLSNTDLVQVTVEDPVAQITRYCHGGFNELTVINDDGVETYEIVVQELGATPTPATGTREGDSLALESTVGDFAIKHDVTFSSDNATIVLKVEAAVGDNIFLLNEYGSSGACVDYEGTLQTLPKVVKNDLTDLSGFIEDISYFRSSAGHDYSDSTETCRSMKHYFSPREDERKNDNVPIYSPFSGTIVQLNSEEGNNFVDDGITDQRTMILSDDNSSILAVLFHIDLLSTELSVGTTVAAGQQLGNARMIRTDGSVGHDFDIGIHVNMDSGVRYVSYFDVLADEVFAGYSGFGSYRSDFIITEAERNADPLTCDGQTFTSNGSLARWIFDI